MNQRKAFQLGFDTNKKKRKLAWCSKHFLFPLRLSIPAILLLFGGSLSLFSFQREVSLSYLHTEEDGSRQIRNLGDQTSGMLEYLFVFRRADKSGADLIISKLGINPNLQLALLCDENNKILFATRYELRNRLVLNTPIVNRLSDFERVRQTMSGEVILSNDRQSIRAIYPVMLGSAPDEIRPSKVGTLLLEYDISALKQRSYADALQRSLEASGVLALLCTSVWFFFDKTLTLRAVRLVEATNRLAKGELSVRAELQGSDELAQISAAFDQMANQIQVDQQQMQVLATQRKELSNLLASQIRNSLDLDTILSTAVSETRALLGVDRCNFVWCSFDDSAPSFHLSHEARLPDLPSLVGQYQIKNPKNSDLEAILTFKTIRIDDLTTDTFLDATWRERLIAQGYASFVCCPIQTRSGKQGLICCAHCHTIQLWSDNEVELLQSVASQLAIAMHQAELYKQISYQALHDLLTGLPNRVLFNDRLSLALANAHRGQGLLCVMFMDLDHFKKINDTLGHAYGDQLLQEVAKRLTDCLRKGDTVARWGGDEFTLLLPQIVDVKDATKIAQRILEDLRPAFNIEGHQLHISNSIGIALYPDDGEDAENLLKNADAALYRAKEQGRNNYQMYTGTMNSDACELLTLENSLHHALEREEFVVYYQPQVNINTWEITGMEALLRWQHPTLGLVSPGIFIPMAEENGLIVPIGEWVLRTACAQNKAWQDMGLQGLRVAVNLAAQQFHQQNLVAIVRDRVRGSLFGVRNY